MDTDGFERELIRGRGDVDLSAGKGTGEEAKLRRFEGELEGTGIRDMGVQANTE